jgi:hypothetical protein
MDNWSYSMANWESLIGAKIEAHRDTHTVCKIEDAGKRNSRRAQLKWKHEHRSEENERRRKWEAKNPDKVKAYREKAKPAIKRWAEEHPERKRELNRKSDAKRRNSPKRKAWEAAYRKTDEYKERRREFDRKRNQTPERKAWERERSKRRMEAAKAAKTKEVA